MTDPRIEARHKARVIEETEEDKQRRIAFRAVAKTPEGQWVLRWFMEETGFKAPVLAMVGSTISPTDTIYNVSKRDVWIAARKHIPWDLLNAIEAERKPKNGTDTEDDEI